LLSKQGIEAGHHVGGSCNYSDADLVYTSVDWE